MADVGELREEERAMLTGDKGLEAEIEKLQAELDNRDADALAFQALRDRWQVRAERADAEIEKLRAGRDAWRDVAWTYEAAAERAEAAWKSAAEVADLARELAEAGDALMRVQHWPSVPSPERMRWLEVRARLEAIAKEASDQAVPGSGD